MGGVHIGARALLDINLAISLAYPSGKEGGISQVQIIFLPAVAGLEEGGGGEALCALTL